MLSLRDIIDFASMSEALDGEQAANPFTGDKDAENSLSVPKEGETSPSADGTAEGS